MKLKDARKVGIKYCEENDCSYACISFSEIYEFTVTSQETKNTVYLVNRNGSLDPYYVTNYAKNYHKEREKKESGRGNGSKRAVAELLNCAEEE